MAHLEIVIEVIAANTKLEPKTITPSTPLASLGIASLDVLQIIFDLESRLGITIPDGAAEQLTNKTVGDLADLTTALKDGTWAAASS